MSVAISWHHKPLRMKWKSGGVFLTASFGAGGNTGFGGGNQPDYSNPSLFISDVLIDGLSVSSITGIPAGGGNSLAGNSWQNPDGVTLEKWYKDTFHVLSAPETISIQCIATWKSFAAHEFTWGVVLNTVKLDGTFLDHKEYGDALGAGEGFTFGPYSINTRTGAIS